MTEPRAWCIWVTVLVPLVSVPKANAPRPAPVDCTYAYDSCIDQGETLQEESIKVVELYSTFQEENWKVKPLRTRRDRKGTNWTKEID
jgi:hypothetical protein